MKYYLLVIILFQLSWAHSQVDISIDSLELLIRNNLWDKPKIAQDYADQYIQLASNQDDIAIKARGQNFKGLTHYALGNYIQAVQYYLKSYELIKQTDDKRYEGILLNNIGAAYRVREKPDETEIYYKKALDVFNEINDTLWIANVTNNLAIVLNAKLEFSEAEKYFLQARERYQQLQDSASLNTLAVNIGSLYTDMEEWDKVQENIDIFFRSNPPVNDLYVYGKHLLARKAMNNGAYAESEAILQETIRITEEKGLSHAGLNAKSLYYQLQKLVGNDRNTLLAYEDYVAQKDSIFSKEKDEQLTEMLEKYESLEKEAEIDKLALADELNQTQISRQRMGLLAALSGLGLLGFFFYRLRQKNQRIQKQDQEKEVLLKEIHHRVKNNLQVISSLLGLQGLSIKDAKAKAAIQEGRSRVHSMSLIHQSLYKKDNLTGIEMKPYLESLIHDLIDTYNYRDIAIQSDIICDDITLDVETVVPIGLIINELVTNSVKYAFEDRERGTITTTLNKVDQQLKLRVKDNGIGLNSDQLKVKEETFGHSLIRAFRDKLDADVNISSNNGTQVELIIRSYKLL